MSRYQEIRDSKIDWIGKIPSHWNIDKIKYIFFQRKEKNNPIQTDNILSLTIQQGVIPISEKKSGGNKPKDDLSKYNLTHEGDIVMNSMNVIVGSVGISNYFGVVSPVYYVLRQINSEENIRYYHHLFRTKIFQKSLMGLGNGILIKKTESSGKLNTIRMRIPIDKLNQVIIPHPPSSEQTQIVSFLDNKTQKIDELIEKTEQKIKLLKEKRTSLINHCVTKGLYPDVDMKDSGVEWIGEIPRDWNIIPLKFVGDFQNGIGKGSEFFGSGFPFMNYGDVYNNEITPISVDGKVQSDEIERERYSVLRGDVFFTRTSESKDDIGVSSVCLKTLDESVFSGFVIRFRFFDNSQIPEYSRYHFQTHWKKVFIESKMNIVTRSSLSQQVLGQLPVLIPSNEQQIQIVEYLDEQTQKIDSTIEKETQRIELLKEYRQSLISEVVTGKVDVRDYNG